MSWVKRNLYFVISCVVAVALLAAAGWYCYSEWQGSDASSTELTKAYGQLNDFANKQITPNTENIDAAKKQAKQAQDLAESLQKHLAQIPSIPNTNNVNDQTLAAKVRDTIRLLAASAEANHVVLPLDYAFSFSAQRDKAVYATQGRDHLARQLGEVKVLCGVLFSNRIDSLEGVQRERTADDAASAGTQNDTFDALSVTNNNTIISPYQVTFLCFDPALHGVLAGFANQPYGIMVRSIEVVPADLTSTEMTSPLPGMNPGGMENRFQPGVTPTAPGARGILPVVVDEKRLRVTMFLELVRVVPNPGR
jgi:hypothetical protein